MATAARRGAAPATAAPARGARTARASAPTIRTGYSGAVGLARAKQEMEANEAKREARKAAGFMPFRFFVTPGETRTVIIVDAEPTFFRFEHALLNRTSGKYDNFVPCVSEHADCAACRADQREPYFAMYLTVIDCTEYTNRDGEVIPWSKKLLVIKPMQQKKYIRLFEQHGTLRGAVLELTRDGDKDAAIGNDVQFIEFADEDEMLDYETVYVDRENKETEIIGHEAFDYLHLFPELTEQQIAALAGVRMEPAVGSRAGNRRAMDEEQPQGRAHGRAAAPGRRGPPQAGSTATRRPARGAAPQDDDQGPDDGQGDYVEDAPQAPARGAARRAPAQAAAPARGAAPARRSPTRQAEPEEAPAEPAQRTVARRSPAARPPADEAPPARGGGDSLANRRALLRGNR